MISSTSLGREDILIRGFKRKERYAAVAEVNEKSMAELDFSKGQKEVDTGPAAG